MSNDSQDRTVEIISDHHDQFAKFARESFEAHGRGVIYATFPNVPPGHTVIGSRDMKYIAQSELKDLLIKDDGEDATVVLRMVDTYDPSRQAVVTAAIDGELPITIKLKLEKPTLVDGPDRVQ